jgi:phosphoribosyl 1,2-cyclic phosphate phosphodiesterase
MVVDECGGSDAGSRRVPPTADKGLRGASMMRVEFLGTGGAITTPQPLCSCTICAEAREKGVPYSRSGPSVFVHGPDLLVDTPEEIKDQLNRSRVERIGACVYSHWHPDHVMGRRLFEMNKDFREWPARDRCTTVFLPAQVAADMKSTLGTWQHFQFFEAQGLVRVVEVPDDESFELQGHVVRPFRLAESYVYAFVIEGGGKRLLVAPDELNGWEPPRWVRGVDLAVLPMGVVEFHPLTGERQIAEEHPVLRGEATFAETLEIVRKLGAARVFLTHIEEPDGLSFDVLEAVEDRLREGGLAISFAHDTELVDV